MGSVSINSSISRKYRIDHTILEKYDGSDTYQLRLLAATHAEHVSLCVKHHFIDLPIHQNQTPLASQYATNYPSSNHETGSSWTNAYRLGGFSWSLASVVLPAVP